MKKSNIKVSIVVPVYNSQSTLVRCIDSIIMQTYDNIEVLLVNDGSSDDSASICESYTQNDSRVKVIHNTNMGVSYSRNCGIDYSSGDYITFVDSDDFLEKNCIFDIIELIKQENYDFVRYNFKTIDGRKETNSMYELSNKAIQLNTNNRERLFYHFLTNINPITNFSVLLVIKKEILNKVRYDTSLTMLEDVDFYCGLITVSNNCFFLDKKNYNYVFNPNSSSHAKDRIEQNIFSVIEANKKIKRDYELDEKIVLNMNSNHLRIIDNFLIENGKYHATNHKVLVNKMISNDDYQDMLRNSCIDNMPLKNKINIFLIGKKWIGMYFLFEKLLVSLIKMKNKRGLKR